jgi:hypothetical protein
MREADSDAMQRGAPPSQHPDPNQSGPSPRWVSHCAERLQTIIRDQHYRPQLEARLQELERERTAVANSVTGQLADLERLETTITQLQELMP